MDCIYSEPTLVSGLRVCNVMTFTFISAFESNYSCRNNVAFDADEHLERLEGKTRKCLFFYVKIFEITV